MSDKKDMCSIDPLTLCAAFSAAGAICNPRRADVSEEEIMRRRFSWIAVGLLIACQFACDGTINQPPKVSPPPAPSANISISPGSVVEGAPDLSLTISGSEKFTFSDDERYSVVVWSRDGVDEPLLTTFVSSSQLTAIVPAALLATATAGNVRVEIWDRTENTRVATSTAVSFYVTKTPIPIPSISSISPSTVAAGSADVTMTIKGSNFGHYGHFVWSTAFWTTNGNLHDTGTSLQTTITSDKQLTVVIPSKLLERTTSVQIVVMNGDVMGMSDGFFGYPRSNSLIFTVTP